MCGTKTIQPHEHQPQVQRSPLGQHILYAHNANTRLCQKKRWICSVPAKSTTPIALYICVAPTLFIHMQFPRSEKKSLGHMRLGSVRWVGGSSRMHLVVEASVVVEMVEIGQESFSVPKFHTSNLKVVVDYPKISTWSGGRRGGRGRQTYRCKGCVHHCCHQTQALLQGLAWLGGTWGIG
jgi:hypothetical protein